MPNLYAFDCDDTLENGGQLRTPPTAGPVRFKDVLALKQAGHCCGVVGNWMGIPNVLPNWRDYFEFFLPAEIGYVDKAPVLMRLQIDKPGYDNYVMVGNDPQNLPTYWARYAGQWNPVGGESGISNDIGAARKANWRFIKEDAFAAGERLGTIPPSKSTPRPEMIHKSFQIPGAILKANFDNGIVEAIVSVTGNVDYQKDVIVPGAFNETLKSGRLPKVVKAHDWDTWLGKTVDAAEFMPGDAKLPAGIRDKGYGGLYVKGEFTMEDPIAAGVYAHLKRGVIDEFSIGFDIASDEKGLKAEEFIDDIRYIKTAFPLYEWSPVLMGANPATLPLAVKSAPRTASAKSEHAAPHVTDQLLKDIAIESAARILAARRRRS